MANSAPFRFSALLTFLLSAQAAQVESTRDPNRIAHELFAPSANVVTLNASVSGPDNAIAIFSGADKDISTASKSGIVLSTGDATSQLPGVGGEGTARAEVLAGQARGLPQNVPKGSDNGARGDSRPPIVGDRVTARGDSRPPSGGNEETARAERRALPGNEQLAQLSSGKTSDAATISFQFQTTGETKNLRINIAFVTQESAARIQQGFDDVFAVFLDGELAQFVRASETKEAAENQNKPEPGARGATRPTLENGAEAIRSQNGARGATRPTSENSTRPTLGKNPRIITQSKLIELSPDKIHSLKIAIADVGDNNGDSFAFISITGSDDSDPFTASPLLVAVLPPETPQTPGTPDGPEELIPNKGTPPGTPPTTTPPPPPQWPPVTALSGPKRFEKPPPPPTYAPPAPPYIAPGPPTVSVPDHSNSITLLIVGMTSLFLLRYPYVRKCLSFRNFCKNC